MTRATPVAVTSPSNVASGRAATMKNVVVAAPTIRFQNSTLLARRWVSRS